GGRATRRQWRVAATAAGMPPAASTEATGASATPGRLTAPHALAADVAHGWYVLSARLRGTDGGGRVQLTVDGTRVGEWSTTAPWLVRSAPVWIDGPSTEVGLAPVGPSSGNGALVDWLALTPGDAVYATAGNAVIDRHGRPVRAVLVAGRVALPRQPARRVRPVQRAARHRRRDLARRWRGRRVVRHRGLARGRHAAALRRGAGHRRDEPRVRERQELGGRP